MIKKLGELLTILLFIFDFNNIFKSYEWNCTQIIHDYLAATLPMSLTCRLNLSCRTNFKNRRK